MSCQWTYKLIQHLAMLRLQQIKKLTLIQRCRGNPVIVRGLFLAPVDVWPAFIFVLAWPQGASQAEQVPHPLPDSGNFRQVSWAHGRPLPDHADRHQFCPEWKYLGEQSQRFIAQQLLLLGWREVANVIETDFERKPDQLVGQVNSYTWITA